MFSKPVLQLPFSGFASMITVIVLSFHLGISFWYPSKYKDYNYYLVKDLVNSFFLFFCVPLATVLRNDKMRNYVINHIKNNDIVSAFANFYFKYIEHPENFRPRANKIFTIELKSKP